MCVGINLYFVWPVLAFAKVEKDGIILSDYLLGVGAGLTSVVFVFAFLLIINNNFVKERGFRYAKTLLESCEEPYPKPR